MSLEVQASVDLALQSGALKPSEASNSGDSAEFASVIDDISNDCASCSAGDTQTDDSPSQDTGSSETESGNNSHTSGNELPSDTESGETDEFVLNDGSEEQSSDLESTEALENNSPDSEFLTGVLENIESDSGEPILQVNTQVSDAASAKSQITGISLLGDSELPAELSSTDVELSLDQQSSDTLLNTLNTVDPEAAETLDSVLAQGTMTDQQKGNALTAISGANDNLDTVLTPRELLRQNSLGTATEIGSKAGLNELGSADAALAEDMPAFKSQDNLRTSDAKTMLANGESLKELLAGFTKEQGGLSSSAGGNQPATNQIGGLGAGITSAANSQISAQPSANTSNQLLTLNTPVTDAAWADDFGVRIRTLVSGNVQQATLSLNPAELGAIEIKLSTDGNETRAQFIVQNPHAREALEASLPRLREIFEESGMSLADTDVRDQANSQHADSQSEQRNPDGRFGAGGLASNDQTEDTPEYLTRWNGNGLSQGIDTFI